MIFVQLYCSLGPPSIVVGESGGVRVYTAAQNTGTVVLPFIIHMKMFVTSIQELTGISLGRVMF